MVYYHEPMGFDLWRWLGANTERPIPLKEKLITSSFQDKGVHHTIQGHMKKHQFFPEGRSLSEEKP